VGEHGLSFSKRAVKIHRTQIQNLFATGGQELASNGRGFGSAALDLIHVNAGQGFRAEGTIEQFGGAGKNDQQIIKIVGEAAGDAGRGN
jgi:hypothetical protein